MTPDDRLIVALDTPNAAAARRIVERLGDSVGFYKVGLGMLAGGGLDLARDLKAGGKRVFLDLKLFDIPATVTAAVRGLAGLGVDFLTVHGDPHVVAAARTGAGDEGPKVLAVTILTALDRGDLDAAQIRPGPVADIVRDRARRAVDAGADGVIAAPSEAADLRALAPDRLIVCPGIRPAGAATDDQKRIATPDAALAAGADHIVVGRPIHAAPDPRAAAEAILESLG